jgi:hypothetical protein
MKMHKCNIKNVTQIVTLQVHVSKTVMEYDKNPKPKLKNQITCEDQAYQISGQLDQQWRFHKQMKTTYQNDTMLNQKISNKNPEINKS